VYTLHDLTWWKWAETASLMGRRYYAPLARRVLRRDVHLVTVSHAVADEAAEFFGIDREAITVAPLGVELPEPGPRTGRPRPYLLSVGTLEPRKNLQRLAEAYARSGVAATHDLVFVGRTGWGAAPPGVHIVSGLDDVGLAGMYRDATALVLPSLYEGFGLPAVEAMQMGVPVLCSDIPALREVTGGYATYVDATDTDSLTDALRDVTDAVTPPGAATWARKTFRWETTVKRLSDLYRRLDAELQAAGR
jgi:glycosyltransferase involved in cell wall biosynthesis